MKIPDGDFTLRVAALIIDNNRLLTVKHDDFDCFYTIGGRVKANETSVDAAIREAYEESGYRFDIDRLVFVQERFYRTGDASHHEVVFFYLMKLCDVSIEDGACTDHAKEKLHWLPMGELQNSKLVPEFLRTALTDIPSTVVHVVSEE